MKTTLLAGFASSLLAGVLPIGAIAADSPALKFGLCINFGMQTFARPGEQGELPASRFAPASVNVKSWAHAAKEAGTTFAVSTVKLGGGFCLWQTADDDYDIAHSPFKGDILGDFIAACNAEGILPGAFYSVPDAHNEGAARAVGPVPNLYFNFIKKQITELHTKYPGLCVQIFGGSDRFSAEQWTDLVQLVHRVNPQCVILDGKHEDVTQFGGGTVIKSWHWQPNAELVPAAQLFRLYDQAQTAKKSLMLTVGADPSGNIPDDQIAVLSQLKEMIANPPPAQTTTAPAAKPDAAERLKKVKALYDQGLINKEDYDKKVKEIMDAL
jgi:alpha-L-fucosidase